MAEHQDGCTCGACDMQAVRHGAIHALMSISDMANLFLAQKSFEETGEVPTFAMLSAFVEAHRAVFNVLGVSNDEMLAVIQCEEAAEVIIPDVTHG